MAKIKNLPGARTALWREDWATIVAQCKERPNEVAVVLENRPVSRAKSLNSRRTSPVVDETGRLRAYVRNSYEESPGRYYGDLHIVWEPS